MEIQMRLALPLILLGGFALNAATRDEGDATRTDAVDPGQDPII